MITLYGPSIAPPVRKVVLGLRLKDLDYELCEPRTLEDYRRWNPATGELPVLEVDSERIADSSEILFRLEKLFPEPPLLAKNARTAGAQRRLCKWVDESFSWYWMRWQKLRPEGPTPLPLGESVPNAPARQEPERPAGVSLRSWLASRMHATSDAGRSERDRLSAELARRIHDLERLLADRAYFYADCISIADLSVYSMLATVRDDTIPGTAVHLERRPRLLAFMKRVEDATAG